jgi:hypothetical protein
VRTGRRALLNKPKISFVSYSEKIERSNLFSALHFDNFDNNNFGVPLSLAPASFPLSGSTDESLHLAPDYIMLKIHILFMIRSYKGRILKEAKMNGLTRIFVSVKLRSTLSLSSPTTDNSLSSNVGQGRQAATNEICNKEMLMIKSARGKEASRRLANEFLLRPTRGFRRW